MRRVVYASFAVQPFSVSEILGLLTHARAKNALRDVTGALFYQDRFFLQCIEGPSVEVSSLMERIARDHRHLGFTILSDQPFVTKRLFSSWSMGFFHMSAVEAFAPEGLIANGTAFETAIDPDQAMDPAAHILKQYWEANARNLDLSASRSAPIFSAQV